MVTPAAAVRGDAGLCRHERRVGRRDQRHGRPRSASPPTSGRSYYRYMATAGLEWRWPVLFSIDQLTHILEPMAQVFARPDEQYDRAARHSERGRAELRLRRVHAVRARQVLRLRPDRGRHARQCRRALLRRLRQRLDDQRDLRPVLSSGRRELLRRAGSRECRRLFGLETPIRPTMSAWSASPRPRLVVVGERPPRRADLRTAARRS